MKALTHAEILSMATRLLAETPFRIALYNLAIEVTDQVELFVKEQAAVFDPLGTEGEDAECAMALCLGWILGFGPGSEPDDGTRKQFVGQLVVAAALAAGMSSNDGTRQARQKVI